MTLNIVALRLLLSLALFVSAGAAAAQPFVSIAAATVGVREQPDTRAAVRWELIEGYPLRVSATRGEWVRVRDFDGDLGWIPRRRIEREPHHVVRARVANLRSAPRLQARVLARLERYEVLKTLRREGDWVEVQRAGGQRGWVARETVWGW